MKAPSGRAIIGGVITSTILTLVVIPTMYEILDDWRLKLKGMFKIPERPKTEEYMIPRELRESAPKRIARASRATSAATMPTKKRIASIGFTIRVQSARPQVAGWYSSLGQVGLYLD